MARTEKGRIVHPGMGGFLNPPTHPEHDWHVETDLRRRPENRGGMSLTAATEATWLDASTRAEARKLLKNWQPPPINSPEIMDWCQQVLGYFRGCYRNPGVPAKEQWNASNVIIDQKRDPVANADDHAGVHLIRKFYPNYVPTEEDFGGAYWGSKPERAAVHAPRRLRHRTGTRPVRRPRAHPREVRAPTRMDDFTRQYMETALWSSTDESDDRGGEPMDKNYGIDDIAPETRDKMIADCANFQERFAGLLEGSELDNGQAGHDFWLSRNGHGAGFFDHKGRRGAPENETFDKLQEAAESYGEYNLYVGDDGMIYGS